MTESSNFLQAFSPTAPASTKQAPGGIDAAAWRRARVAALTAPGKGQADY